MARSKRSKTRKTSWREGSPLRFRPLSLAVATAVGSMAGHVMAQESEDAEAAGDEQMIEEIVVTGFRQSLMNAMELKRDSDLIVEAISAEDIGKLPDNSIAEALTRLTGLAGQRLNGRQQVISIRGLAPDFSTALLNGRQQVSSGDNRGVEFDQYPSELLQSVVVYKTPEAGLTGQGLAGTVDMRTISPLEYGERSLRAANVRNEWTEYDSLNPDVSDSGLRYSLSYTDQNEEGTLGWALGYSSIASPGQREVIDLWGYNSAPEADGALLLTGGNAFSKSGTLERDGIMAVLEYQPSDRISSTIDVYRSSFYEKTLVRQIGLPLFPAWNGWKYGTALSSHEVSDGLVTNGTYENVKAVLSHNLEQRDASLWAAGWNLEADISDSWTATVDVSHSAIDRHDIILGVNSGTGPDFQGALDTIDFSVGNGAPNFSSTLDYSLPGATVLTSPQGWGAWGSGIPGGQVGYNSEPSIEDELTQVRLSAERYMDGTISSVEFGVQFDSRTKGRVNSASAFMALDSGELEQDFTPIGSVTIPFGLPAIATFDPVAMEARGTYSYVYNFHGNVLANDWSVDEDISLGYIQFGIDTEWGSTPVTGNFGVQVVNTDQSSVGSSAANAQGLSADSVGQQSVSGGASFTGLPAEPESEFQCCRWPGRSLRNRPDAGPRANGRIAGEVGRSILNASLVGSTDPANSPWGGSGGNPDLEPWRANSIDLSYEMYFPDGLGYFAGSGVLQGPAELQSTISRFWVDFSDYPHRRRPHPR